MTIRLGLMGAIGVDDIGDIILLKQALYDIEKTSLECDLEIEIILYSFDVKKLKGQLSNEFNSFNMKLEISPILTLSEAKNYIEGSNLNIEVLRERLKHLNYDGLNTNYIKNIMSCDALYFIGGGYFNEYWGEKLWSSFIIPIIIFSNIKRPIFISSVSIGPFSEYTESALKDLFTDCNTIVLRDHSLSVSTLKTLNYTTGNVLLNSDDLLINWLEPNDDIVRFNSDSKEKYMVVHLFHWLEKYANNIEKVYLILSQFLEYVLNMKYVDKVIFMPFNHFRYGKKGGDYIYGDKLKRHLNNSEKVQLLEPTYSYNEMRNIIKNASFVVANRYHPIVFSLGEKTPVLGIYVNDLYKQKLQGTYEVLNINPNEHTFYVNNFSKEDLIEWHKNNVLLDKFPKEYDDLIKNYRLQKINSIKSFISNIGLS